MRAQNVKKTMVLRPQDVILPHYCCSCGEIGDILCESCFYDIVSDDELAGQCVVCMGLSNSDGVCQNCCHSIPYSRAWVVATRHGAVKQLVSVSKYESCRAGCDRQADLLHSIVPILPKDAVVVPVPTIWAHIRQRGFGHTERLAKRFARLRKLNYTPLLYRKASYIQNGADLPTRIRQAEQSFATDVIKPDMPVLLIDDVFTTGSTLKYAAKALRDVGASEVWIAVTSRQTLDG